MICKDGTDWQPTDEQILSWQHAYPEVDVFAELNVMTVWLDSNGLSARHSVACLALSTVVVTSQSKGRQSICSAGAGADGKKPLKTWSQQTI